MSVMDWVATRAGVLLEVAAEQIRIETSRRAHIHAKLSSHFEPKCMVTTNAIRSFQVNWLLHDNSIIH